MHNLAKHEQFIQLLARGNSLVAIAKEIGVARSTLIEWSRRHEQDIQNARAFELHDLQCRLLGSRESRATAYCTQLSRVQEELANRNLKDVPTLRLFELADTLRDRIARETQPPCLVAPSQSSLYGNDQWHIEPPSDTRK